MFPNFVKHLVLGLSGLIGLIVSEKPRLVYGISRKSRLRLWWSNGRVQTKM